MNRYTETFQQYKDKTPIFLMHAGSGNHGCEAIVASLLDLYDAACVRGTGTLTHAILVTNSVAEDMTYSLSERVRNRQLVLIEERHMDRHFIYHVLYYLYRKLTGDRESFLRFRFKPLFRYLDAKRLAPQDTVIYAIGGDNYCYPDMVPDLILANRMLRKKGFETVLVGCSIEPDSLKEGEADAVSLLADLNTYARIIARESITYNALKDAGVPEEKLSLAPDPAFTLKCVSVPVPLTHSGFIPRRTIGINLSPMAQGVEKKEGVTMSSYKALIRHIIDTSNAQVALIPHVVWESNDDRVPLRELYEAFEKTGRVVMIEDVSARSLKAVIAQCSLFIGARTHATIAAYSSGVPTLVLGYSVKSRGIATDLFKGTNVEHMTPSLPAPFVLPVQQLNDPQELIAAYDTLLAHAKEIQEALKNNLSFKY